MDSHALLFSFFTSLLLQNTKAFNLDTHFPIILQDDVDGKDSHFGASITLIQSGWLMIGAPHANSSGENYVDIKYPGVIWRCRVGPGPKECLPVQMDPQGNMDVKMDMVPFELVHRDRKDEGMLGASMASGLSDRFVTCASRWVNQKYSGHHLMNGICYWVSKEHLQSNHTNSTWPWLSSGLSYRLSPLLDRSRQSYTVPTIPPIDPPDRIFDWTFGQTGFSVHLSQNNELILGAPGVLQWSGSVIRFKDIGKKPFANVLVARAQHLSPKNIHHYAYFGYAVTAGKFFRAVDSRIQYASGAPRAASLCGKVLIFNFNDVGESLNLLVEPIQGGNSHFGSYFGSSLAALDTNGDGFDELLVGAPLYKSSSSSGSGNPGSLGESSSPHTPQSSESGDEGCVFIYISDGESFRSTPQEICGENRAGGRFGGAMSSLGDLNMDGYQDVAIGAPYENEGRGAVYIYHGSRTGLVPVQKLDPQEFDKSIRGFGYALSSGIDVDGNSYPDLAVGASSSNHVVIFRTIPVVNITGNLSTSVSKLKTDTGEFNIVSCLSFNGVNVPNSLQIVLKLILDTEVRKQRIAEFVLNSESTATDSTNTIQRTSVYEKSGTCHSFLGTTIGDLDLVTLPLGIRQEFSLLTQPQDSVELKPLSYQIQRNADGNPHLAQTGSLDAVYEDFEKNWPLAMTNVFGATRLSLPIAAICEDDGDPNCLAHLSLKASLRTPEGGIHSEDTPEEFLIGSYRSISLEVEVKNERETANLPLTVTIAWQSPPTVRSSRSDCTRLNPELSGDSQLYECSLRKPLTKNKKDVVELELDMSGVFADRNFLHFELSANTSSSLIQNPTTIFAPPLRTKSEVVVFGQLSDAPYYENLTAETINFTHTFEVGMNGMSPIASVQMEFLIPRDIQINGEFVELLRIREPISTYDGNNLRCVATNGIFYVDSSSSSGLEEGLDLDKIPETGNDVNPHGSSRHKRSSSPFPRVRNKPKPSHLVLNCTMSGIFCLRVECEAHRFRPNSRAVVEFRLRILTQTARLLLTDDVVERDAIIVASEARIVGVNAEGESFGKTAQGVSKTLLKVQPPQEIEAWIVIVSFGGGMILLTFISLILVQCGFFRRTKKEELYALRTEQRICETFGYPDELKSEDYSMDPLPNYHDYEEIYEHYDPDDRESDSHG